MLTLKDEKDRADVFAVMPLREANHIVFWFAAVGKWERMDCKPQTQRLRFAESGRTLERDGPLGGEGLRRDSALLWRA